MDGDSAEESFDEQSVMVDGKGSRNVHLGSLVIVLLVIVYWRNHLY